MEGNELGGGQEKTWVKLKLTFVGTSRGGKLEETSTLMILKLLQIVSFFTFKLKGF